MQDFDQLRENMQHEQNALDQECVIVVLETHHPPCTCHSSHTDTFGVFESVDSLESRLGDVARSRRANMRARVTPLE